MTRPLTLRLAQFATAGAVVAFAASLARHHPDPATAVESGFFALLCGLTLGALALGTRTAPVTISAGLSIALALCLPAADGTRGALVGLLLVGAVGWATWRSFDSVEVSWLDVLAPTLAWQALLRSERLLQFQWTLEALLWLFALPLAAALGLWWLARSERPAPALILLAALAALGPGLGVLAVASLVIAALLARRAPLTWIETSLAAVAAVVAIGWVPAAALPLLVLVAASSFMHQPGSRWLPALVAWSWAAFVLLETPTTGALGWLVLSLPFALLAPAANRPLLLAALALALAAGPGGGAGLAPALALAVLALPENPRLRRAQAAWGLALLAALALAAAYPWLREPPPADLPAVLAAAAVAALVAAFLALLGARPHRRLPRAVPIAIGGLLVVGALALPRSQQLNPEPVVLTATGPTWQSEVPQGAARRLTVDSFVTASGGLAVGRPVASIVVRAADGSRRRIEVLHGLHTADWAARSTDPQAQGPAPWLTWLAGDGSLAQRYRARFELDPPPVASRIEITRASELPPLVEVAILAVTTQ